MRDYINLIFSKETKDCLSKYNYNDNGFIAYMVFFMENSTLAIR